MGVTFDNLFFVVTMDSGYKNVTIGDTVLPVLSPLDVNSLVQRLGRVARLFPGIGYITREIGAPYTFLSDAEINKGGLVNEKISLPMLSGSLATIALYSFSQGWEHPLEDLEDLNLPSKIHLIPERVETFFRQRALLQNIGIASEHTLTPIGEQCERWSGMANLWYAYKLQEALTNHDKEAVMFYLVATSLLYQTSRTPGISDLFKKDGGWQVQMLPAGKVHVKLTQEKMTQVMEDVHSLYVRILRREPSTQELIQGVNYITKKRMSFLQLRALLAMSDEHTDKMEKDANEMVKVLDTVHWALYNRAYDPEVWGHTRLMQVLEDGSIPPRLIDTDKYVRHFVNAQHYASRKIVSSEVTRMYWEIFQAPIAMADLMTYLEYVNGSWSLIDVYEDLLKKSGRTELPEDFLHSNASRYRIGTMARGKALEFCPQSEVIAQYQLVQYLILTYREKLNHPSEIVRNSYASQLSNEFSLLGLREDRIDAFMDTLNECFRTFVDINSKRGDFRILFGDPRDISFESLVFPELSETFIRTALHELSMMPTRIRVEITQNDKHGVFWKEVDGNRQGRFDKRKTSVPLEKGSILTGIMIPQWSTDPEKIGQEWNVTHLQQV